MNSQIKKLLFFIFAFILFAFLLFLVNQVASLYQYFTAIHPVLGDFVLWFSVFTLVFLLIVPVIIYWKLPQPLKPPQTISAQSAYLKKLKKRLQQNRIIRQAKLDMNHPDQFQEGIALLDQTADQKIKSTATAVFLTTSVSQNGKLDAFTVFITQTKLIWDVAHVYYQRPSLREMIALYANVGATTFFASEIEDLDISVQLEPVISSLLRNPGRTIPVIGPVANIVMDSLVEGSANAFLTLRVGVIAKRYCGAMEVFERKKMRKAAFSEASLMLKDIVFKTSGKVINMVLNATKKAGADTFKSGMGAMNKTFENISEKWNSWSWGVKKKKNSEDQ